MLFLFLFLFFCLILLPVLNFLLLLYITSSSSCKNLGGFEDLFVDVSFGVAFVAFPASTCAHSSSVMNNQVAEIRTLQCF